MDNHIPELNSLLTEVEKKYGRRVATSTDFESLSAEIERTNGDLISASTLKRLWGYVNSNPTPRGSTLDILCRYIGERNFKEFCKNLKKNANVESGHFPSKFIATSELSVGQKLLLGWNPDRLCKSPTSEISVSKSLNPTMPNCRPAMNSKPPIFRWGSLSTCHSSSEAR